MIFEAFKGRNLPVKNIIYPMYNTGLSSELVDAFSSMISYSTDYSVTIQILLLNLISLVLSQQKYDVPAHLRYLVSDKLDLPIPERTPTKIKLALNTLGRVDFQTFLLTDKIWQVTISYISTVDFVFNKFR